MKKRLFCAFIIAVCLFAISAAGDERLKQFTTADGLPANEVRAIAEDANGALWFGTDGGGVARYDGASWTVYGEKDGLVNNEARELAFDKDGVLWVGTPRGVSSFDGVKWNTYTTENSGLASNYVISLAVDAKNNKWFGTIDKGVSIFDGSSWKTLTEKDGLAGNRVSAITFDINSNIWLGTHNGLSRYDGAAWKTFTKGKDGLGCDVILSLAFDKQGILWCGTGDGVSSFDGTTWTVYSARTRHNILDDRSIFSVSVDENDVKWFGSIIGIWRYDGETWQSYSRRESGLEKDTYVRAILTDNTGKKWIGTRDALTTVSLQGTPRLQKAAIPKQLVIFNNYPNPFNPSTTIEFVIPESGSVMVDIYTITGQKIRCLLSETLPAGKHAVVWDGKNEAGSAVSSGVYFVRLEAGKEFLSHRITLMK
ncbi:T9SS type A sorting domain-containing protein [bacterium]|nr:T9SS type A sorting domain-containing protein [bacterium]